MVIGSKTHKLIADLIKSISSLSLNYIFLFLGIKCKTVNKCCKTLIVLWIVESYPRHSLWVYGNAWISSDSIFFFHIYTKDQLIWTFSCYVQLWSHDTKGVRLLSNHVKVLIHSKKRIDQLWIPLWPGLVARMCCVCHWDSLKVPEWHWNPYEILLNYEINLIYLIITDYNCQ